MRKLKLPIFILILLLSTISVVAEDKWIAVESDNFRFYGNGDQKSLSKVAEQLEQFRGAFALIFPSAKLTDPVETKVFFFKDRESFKPFLPKRSDGTPDTGIAGYFLATESSNHIALSDGWGGNQSRETIYHEFVHYLLNNNFRRTDIPAWLNEGLAEYYSTLQVRDGKKIYFGNVIPSHLRLFRQTNPMPLKRLFEFENKDIHGNGGTERDVFYAQSWALVHYLGSKGKLDKVGEFVAAIGKGKNHKRAFEETFGLTYDEVESGFAKYVKRRKFNQFFGDLEKRSGLWSPAEDTRAYRIRKQCRAGYTLCSKVRIRDSRIVSSKGVETGSQTAPCKYLAGVDEVEAGQQRGGVATPPNRHPKWGQRLLHTVFIWICNQSAWNG